MYKNPASDTYIDFGEASLQAQMEAASKSRSISLKPINAAAAAGPAPIIEEDKDDEDVDAVLMLESGEEGHWFGDESGQWQRGNSQEQ